MNVIGVEWALASIVVSHRSAPLSELNARNRRSMVPPMKISPDAVAIVPPMFGVPVLSNPRAFKSASNAPTGYTINCDGQGGVAGFGKGSADVSWTPISDSSTTNVAAYAICVQ